MDYRQNILRNLHVKLNNLGTSLMERRCHWWYYINIFVYIYLLCNWQDLLAINESGLQSTEQKYYRRVLSILKSRYLKYTKYLLNERKSDISISNEMWQRVFRSGVGSYIFTFLSRVRTWFIYFPSRMC